MAASFLLLPLQALPARQQVLQWLGLVQPQHLWALRERAHRSTARVWVASIAPAAGSRYCVLGSWLLQQIGTQGSMLAALWTQQPEGPQGKLPHFTRSGGVEPVAVLTTVYFVSANNQLTENTPKWTALGKKYSEAPLPVGDAPVPPISHCNSEWIWGLLR